MDTTKTANYVTFINETSYLANKFDQTGHVKRAIQCYMLCIKFLNRLKQASSINSNEMLTINERIVEYQNQIDRLTAIEDENSKKIHKVTMVGDKKKTI